MTAGGDGGQSGIFNSGGSNVTVDATARASATAAQALASARVPLISIAEDPYLATPDISLGTDQYTKLYNAVNQAHSDAGAIGGRKTVLLPPGKYRIDTRLTVPHLVDLKMMPGARIVYMGSDFSGPALQLGTDGNLARYARHENISVLGVQGQKLTPSEVDTFALVRVHNMDNSYCSFRELWYGGVGLQLKPNSGGSIGYSTFEGGFAYGCKTGLDLRTNGTGWVNQNTFDRFNATLQQAGHLGSVSCLRFSRESGSSDYNQNGNVFINPCFQPQSWALGTGALKFADAGGNATLGNWYVNSSQTIPRQYYCTTGGTFTGTGATHVDLGGASQTAGGTAEFQDQGPYYRIPILHDQAGYRNYVYGARQGESGAGGFVLVRTNSTSPPPSGEYQHFGFFDQYQDFPTRPEVDAVLLNPAAAMNSDFDIHITTPVAARPRPLIVDDIHKRFLQSASVCTIQGMQFCNVTTGALSQYSATGSCALLADAVYFYDNERPPCLFVDSIGRQNVRGTKRYRASYSPGNPGTDAIWVAPYDANNNRISTLAASNYYYSDTDKICTNINANNGIWGPWQIYSVGGTSLDFSFGSDSTVQKFLVGINYYLPIIRQFTITPFGEGVTDQPRAYTLYEQDSTVRGPRSIYNIPTAGHFDRVGEIIHNLNSTAGQPLYWIVKTAGVLCPIWTNGQTIAKPKYLRYYGSNVYYAVAAGTCGATPPTHTSGTVSDGGVSWTYHGPLAAIQASTQNYA